MYTRFKSSKGGLKLGLTTITNTSRSKVAIQNGTKTLKHNDNDTVIKANDVNNTLKSPILSDLPAIENQCYVLMTDDDKFSDNIDENCVKFVQSKWQEYVSEVGTPNGPTRYVDLSENHEHLKGFSAFDMDRWAIDHMHAWLLQTHK